MSVLSSVGQPAAQAYVQPSSVQPVQTNATQIAAAPVAAAAASSAPASGPQPLNQSGSLGTNYNYLT
jgi:hypothetical protein